jgi:hypothetical protein
LEARLDVDACVGDFEIGSTHAHSIAELWESAHRREADA